MSPNRERGHELLPQEVREKLPSLYSQEALGLQALAIVKLFSPYSNWTWYASEGSSVDANGYYDTDSPKVDFLLFGLVAGHKVELGYFSVSELETAHHNDLSLVERDLHWKPDTLVISWRSTAKNGVIEISQQVSKFVTP